MFILDILIFIHEFLIHKFKTIILTFLDVSYYLKKFKRCMQNSLIVQEYHKCLIPYNLAS